MATSKNSFNDFASRYQKLPSEILKRKVYIYQTKHVFKWVLKLFLYYEVFKSFLNLILFWQDLLTSYLYLHFYLKLIYLLHTVAKKSGTCYVNLKCKPKLVFSMNSEVIVAVHWAHDQQWQWPAIDQALRCSLDSSKFGLLLLAWVLGKN